MSEEHEKVWVLRPGRTVDSPQEVTVWERHEHHLIVEAGGRAGQPDLGAFVRPIPLDQAYATRKLALAALLPLLGEEVIDAMEQIAKVMKELERD